jgi:hypothetical protein
LLYHVLGSHPRVALTNEARVFDFLYFGTRLASLPDDAVADFEFEERARLRGVITRPFVEAFAAIHARHARTMVLEFYEELFPEKDFLYFGDKMPNPLAALATRDLFPETRYVVLVRDPRDYLCSVGQYVRRPSIAAPYPHLDTGARAQCEHWCNVYRGARSHLGEVAPLRYEDLVREPRKHVEAILADLGLEPHAACLEALAENRGFSEHATAESPEASVGRWRQELSEEDQRLVKDTCGELMREMGYSW